MPRPTRTDRSRALILDAADRAFRAQGFAQTSVEQIAEAAGLSRKTVYNLFTSKEDLAAALIARGEAATVPLYAARLEAGEPALAVLERALMDSAGWCKANPDLARIALLPRNRPRAEPLQSGPSFHGIVRAILRHGQTQGVIRSDEDAGVLALILLGVFGQAMLSAIDGDAFEADDLRRVIRILVQGIGARG